MRRSVARRNHPLWRGRRRLSEGSGYQIVTFRYNVQVSIIPLTSDPSLKSSTRSKFRGRLIQTVPCSTSPPATSLLRDTTRQPPGLRYACKWETAVRI